MKPIYSTVGIWDGEFKVILDVEKVPKGYTDIPPIQPNYKLKFEKGKWVETATQEEIANWYGTPEPIEPTPEQLMINQLGLQVAKLTEKLAELGA